MKRTDADKLQQEYEKLVAGLQQANEHREDEDMLANPVPSTKLSEEMVDEAVPGNIRKAEHFIAFLKRFIEYLRVSCFVIRRRSKLMSLSDADESPACGSGDAAIFPGALEGDHVHRATAAEVCLHEIMWVRLTNFA